ncbi:MAG: hypothetical protein IJS81_05335 [Selenomonadaceae bacterium]|nr:hypothetical protein [Selenomonadaceae bacterium]
MAKGDKLDALLADERITDEEWAALGEVLGIYKILSKKKNERRVIVNKEFRHYFGHTLANFFRNDYEPDYFPILKETFEKMGFNFTQYKKIHCIEEDFYNVVTENFNAADFDDEKDFFKKLIKVGENSWGFGKGIKNISLKDGAVAVAGGIPLAVINKTFFDTNWKKVIPTILIVSLIRKRLKILDEFEDI